MKIFNYIFILSLVFVQLGEIRPQTKPFMKIKLIVSQNAFSTAKVEDVVSLTKILGEILIKNTKREGEVTVAVTKNVNEIIEQITPNYNLIIFSVSEFLELSKKTKIEAFGVNESSGDFGYRYLLLVNRDSKINSIQDLKGKTIEILIREATSSTPSLWLDKLLRDRKQPLKEKFFSEINLDFKANKVINSLFFKKIDVCIVPESAFEIACSLNPQLKTKLQILQKSERLLQGIGGIICNNNCIEEDKKLIINTLLSAHESKTGRQGLILFNIDKLLPYKKEYLNSYLELLKK